MSERFSRLVRIALVMAAASTGWAGGPASAAALRISLDRPLDGAAAPFAAAAARGLFRDEGLSVTIDAASGSTDAISRVASGMSDLALADINALIRYRDGKDAVPIKAVFVLYNTAPYAMIARKSRGIATLRDLQGKTIGLVDNDLAVRLWPAVARQAGISPDKVKAEKISAAVREPLLSAGQVDAVSGFSFLSAVNLRNRGVPASDLVVLRFADFGGETYGHALIVNPKFAAAQPEAVRGFIRATIAGVRLAAADPGRAIDDVMAQMNGGDRDVELERLRTVLHDDILTAEVRRDGLGGIDAARFARALDQIAVDHEFRHRPDAADIFDGAFLPPPAARRIDDKPTAVRPDSGKP